MEGSTSKCKDGQKMVLEHEHPLELVDLLQQKRQHSEETDDDDIELDTIPEFRGQCCRCSLIKRLDIHLNAEFVVLIFGGKVIFGFINATNVGTMPISTVQRQEHSLSCLSCFLLTVRHRYDKKHAFNLSYFPAENHVADYFCDICLVEMSTSTSILSSGAVTALKITHTLIDLSFVQGLASDGNCTRCERALRYKLIFKCSQCKFAIDYDCCKKLSTSEPIIEMKMRILTMMNYFCFKI
nr:hypothetical protein [Tanacetum cinerariifolium]GEZ64342.1 hypothetical protein [Tanacetum cinerariifolium]